MKKIFVLTLILFTSSCGKNSSGVFSEGSIIPSYEYVRPFAMSTNEKLLEQYEIIHEVDLRNEIPGFENLPIEQESFQQIYDLLKVDQNLYSKFTVLKKTADCQALVGYCKAYYIKR